MTPLPFGASYVAPIPERLLSVYERAIAEFGEAELFVHRGCEFHDCNLFRDLSAFWEVFQRFEKQLEQA